MEPKFIVSARGKKPNQAILDYIKTTFNMIDIKQVVSVYGFLEYCSLYGGRLFFRTQINENDVKTLYDNGIGIGIPLTNHYVTYTEYKDNKQFISKYHREGNSVIVVNDDLAKWIKNDFQKFSIKASTIKRISTHEAIEEARKLYDYIVLPMSFSINGQFLSSIEKKDDIIVFGNAGCDFSCPYHSCYEKFSRSAKNPFGFIDFSDHFCSNKNTESKIIFFNLNELMDLGFHLFKFIWKEGKKTVYMNVNRG